MIIRTSQARMPSFALNETDMIERDPKPYKLYRADLRKALELNSWFVHYWFEGLFGIRGPLTGDLSEGKTQRGKKFLQIGCKRFVGENRRKLIRWAMSAK